MILIILFSTVWSDCQFDHNLLEYLIHQVDCHFSFALDNGENIIILCDFVMFNFDSLVSNTCHYAPVNHPLNPTCSNTNNDNTANYAAPTIVDPTNPLSTPLLNSQMFSLPRPQPTPVPTSKPTLTALEQHLCLPTSSKFWQQPVLLVPSCCHITHHIAMTTYITTLTPLGLNIKNACDNITRNLLNGNNSTDNQYDLNIHILNNIITCYTTIPKTTTLVKH